MNSIPPAFYTFVIYYYVFYYPYCVALCARPRRWKTKKRCRPHCHGGQGLYNKVRGTAHYRRSARYCATRPGKKSALLILALRERRLDAVCIRETTAISNLSNCCIADNIVLQTQASPAAYAIAPPAIGASTTSTIPASTLEKKIMKRKLPEPRDGWKDSACTVPIPTRSRIIRRCRLVYGNRLM